MNITVGPYDIHMHIQPRKILEKFTQYKKTSPEAGGIILGKIIDNQIHILKLSIPTSLDNSSRTNFERNKLSAQIILDYEFHNSNGQIIYLGEWHTHPELHPTPSQTDLRMLKSQFKNNSLNTDFLLLLIKGTEGIYVRILKADKYFELIDISLIV
jgi:integrative and conjugative element protein (TIGR02256 family)